MRVFSYTLGSENTGLMLKGGAEKPAYQVDFNDGMPSGSTISAITCGATDANTQNSTATCVSSATTVGVSLAQVLMLTTGQSGTVPGFNGDRFRLRTTATLSNGSVLYYDTFVTITNALYDPTP